MNILVIAEHDNASLRPATLNTITAAARVGGAITVLVAGHACAAAVAAAAQVSGVTKVLSADAPQFEHALAEDVAALVLSLAAGYTHLMAPASSFGKNFMPRVAALLDVAQVSDIVAVESADTFVRPIYAGNALATVQSRDAVKVITVRATAFDAAGATGGSAAVDSVQPPAPCGLSASCRRNCRSRRAPNWALPGSWCPAGAASAAPSTTTPCSNRWPTSSAPRSAPAAPRSIRATRRTTIRSARPARSSRPTCTSRSVCRAPSSTWPA
jgi:hypothetical protein